MSSTKHYFASISCISCVIYNSVCLINFWPPRDLSHPTRIQMGRYAHINIQTRTNINSRFATPYQLSGRNKLAQDASTSMYICVPSLSSSLSSNALAARMTLSFSNGSYNVVGVHKLDNFPSSPSSDIQGTMELISGCSRGGSLSMYCRAHSTTCVCYSISKSHFDCILSIGWNPSTHLVFTEPWHTPITVSPLRKDAERLHLDDLVCNAFMNNLITTIVENDISE